ncbi:Gx transporter family protein [Anaeromicropila populeti]|uniref:Heptaprenyl diphosphate synthase n=1 Tax=Anaeromicropila populeti TaxID=37658 RepID=A0A1I6IAQ4_9FIRM|nr:Gx transporter family protein [Anaeromicropila populeti]SFR63460.1 heptaprenyl diphosphate synthase [Anaeromicropila populeti]
MNVKKITQFGMLIGVAFILSYIENMIPFYIGIYGVKLGLANIVTVLVLYRFGGREALQISILRVLLVSFTFGNLYSLSYSLAGSLLSGIVMVTLMKTKKFSTVGISIAGGVAHNIGQLIVAMIVLEMKELLYYGGVLIISGSITGFFIGIAAKTTLSKWKN